MKTKNKLAQFEEQASVLEWAKLARHANTSPKYLTYLARGYLRREVGVRKAVAIEKGTKELRKANRKLPVVTCEDLAALCAN